MSKIGGNKVDRITRRIGNSIDFVDGKYANLSQGQKMRLLFEKLANYEDTEMIPEDIKKMHENYIELQNKLPSPKIRELESLFSNLKDQTSYLYLMIKN